MKANNSINYRALTVTEYWQLSFGVGLLFLYCGYWLTLKVSLYDGKLVVSQSVCPCQAAKISKAGWPCKAAGWSRCGRYDSAQEIMDERYGEYDCVMWLFFEPVKISRQNRTSLVLYPWQSDTAGCAISSELAFLLWGSTNLLGMQIKIEGEVLYVRGVFDDEYIKGIPGRQRRNPVIHCQICSYIF